MNKKIKIFLVFLILSLNASVGRSTSETSLPASFPLSCHIQAPTNFHVVNVSTTSVKLAWDNQPDADGGYRIRTYRSSNNALVNTTYRSQDQLDVTIKDLDQNENYYAVINSRCDGGEDSENNSSAPFHTIILEILVEGYTGPTNTQMICSIVSAYQECDLANTPGTYAHFKISSTPNVYRKFGIYYTFNSSNEPTIHVQPEAFNPKIPIRFYCVNNSQVCSNTPEITIKYNNMVIAVISSGVSLGTYTLTCSQLGGFRIDKFDNYDSGKPGDEEAVQIMDRGWDNADPMEISAAPNPFSDALDVFIGYTSDQPLRLALFDLNGKKVLEQTEDGGQDQYTLPTEALSPGFYMLRVEAEGEVQTLKVVKSE